MSAPDTTTRRWLALLLASSLAAAAVALEGGCGLRDRSNPLDPINLASDPNPWAVTASAGNARVTLRWHVLAVDGIDTVEVERRSVAAPDSGTGRWRLPLAAEVLVDSGLTNDRTYRYAFRPELADGRPVAAIESLIATPGPEIVWVANTASLTAPLVRLAPDGRTVTERLGGARFPNDLVLDLERHRLWVADTGHGRVLALDAESGAPRLTVDGFLTPRALSLAPDGSLWVVDEGTVSGSGALVHLAADGRELLRRRGFSRPAAVAATSDGAAVWLVEGGDGGVWLLGSAGDTLLAIEDATRFQRPLVVESAAGDRSAWITDDALEVVVHLAADGSERLRLELGPDRPYGIVLEPGGDAVWIGLNRAGRIERRLVATGALQASRGGFDRPLGLERSARDGSIWVADATGITRLDDAGGELTRLDGLLQPYQLSIASPDDAPR